MPISKKAIAAWPPYPPPGETEEERSIRLAMELRAKRVSDSIDRELDIERESKKKERERGVKILLLGQAESGKSTVLKNFQLHFSPNAFAVEAESWRPAIHLNLIRSVNFILNLLTTQFPPPQESNPMRRPSSSSGLTDDVRRLAIRLRPLREVEDSLIKVFSGPLCTLPADTSRPQQYHPAKASEVAIPSGTGWRKIMKFARQSSDAPRPYIERSDDIQNRRILAACCQDIISLWNHRAVRSTLKSAEVELQEQAGFFLDDVDRIAQENYIPTSEDILRARITTIGPEEHIICAETDNDRAKLWTIYDVGGSRSQRATWAQFFEDINSIIFLAPMSAFNQGLAEDKQTNRLADSVRLWEMICSNKILANVEFILFLNKLDILDAKLKSGVSFSKYVSTYAGRGPNETKPVAKYLLDVFVAKHQERSPKKRKVHPHLTCATDTIATSNIITRLKEIILVKLLAQTNIL